VSESSALVARRERLAHRLFDHHDHLSYPDMTSWSTAMPKLRRVNIADAKARLPELVERAARGEEIIIARNGEPRARLVPLGPVKVRMPGHGAGQWQVGDDFNAPLPADLLAAFQGRRR
jgi:prevent-host-death family protein